MPFEATKAAEAGDPTVAILVVLSAVAIGIAGGYGLSRLFPGDVSPGAYSTTKRKPGFNWRHLFGSDA